MIPVDLNITSIIKSDDDEEKIEFFTVGEYDFKKQTAVLSYEETDGIGYEQCRVSVTVEGSCITIERTGPAASTMCVEKNVKHHSIYGTPFGDFTMGINTYDIQNTLSEAGGRLWFKYSIDINSDFVSENEMEILVTPSGEEEMKNE
ncbi:MAG TPA: DUF1934 domain-containing protein [Ruminococcaceae bacterium]|nr:DUF1934 domain-containing protein [Oscillospiraceae bacterium]